MKKNYVIEGIKILAILLIAIVLLSNISMATDDLLDPNSVTARETDTSKSVNTIMGQALGIVQVIAIGVAVIMMIVLAVKYIAASPSEKADVKKGLTTYFIGALLLFGSSFILGVIKKFATNLK